MSKLKSKKKELSEGIIRKAHNIFKAIESKYSKKYHRNIQLIDSDKASDMDCIYAIANYRLAKSHKILEQILVSNKLDDPKKALMFLDAICKKYGCL